MRAYMGSRIERGHTHGVFTWPCFNPFFFAGFLIVFFAPLGGAQLCTVPDRVLERAQPIRHINEWRALTHGGIAAGVDVVILHAHNTISSLEEHTCRSGAAEPNAEELFFDTISAVVENLSPLARFWTVTPEVPMQDVNRAEDIPQHLRNSWRVLENAMEEAFISELPAIVVVGEASDYNPFTGRAPRFLENMDEKTRLEYDKFVNFLATFVDPEAVGKLSINDAVAYATSSSEEHKNIDKTEFLDSSMPYALLAFTGTVKRHIALKLIAARSNGVMSVSQYMFHDQLIRDHFGLPNMDIDKHAETEPQLVLVNVTNGGSVLGILKGNTTNTWQWVGTTVPESGIRERIVVVEFKGEAIESFVREKGVDLGASPDLADEAAELFAAKQDKAGTATYEKMQKQKKKKPLAPKSKKTRDSLKKFKTADGQTDSNKQFEAQMTLVAARDVELDVLSQSTPTIVILADDTGSDEVESDIAKWAGLVMELHATIHIVWVDTAKEDGKEFIKDHVDMSAMEAVNPSSPNISVFLHCMIDAPLLPLTGAIEVGSVVAEASRVIRTWGGDMDVISTTAELIEAKELCKHDYSILIASVGATKSQPDLFSVILYPLSLEYGMKIAHVHGANGMMVDRFGDMLDDERGGLIALLPNGKQERFRAAYTKAHVNRWFRSLIERLQSRSF